MQAKDNKSSEEQHSNVGMQLEDESQQSEQNDVIAQNVETIADLHNHAERKVGSHQRAIEKVTAFLGRPRFLYMILLFVLLWIMVNVVAASMGFHAFDLPPYNWLQGIISLSALLMTTLVLITQNRQNAVIEQRRRLDLQLNLVVEQKVTKLIDLLDELRHDMPQVKDRSDPEVESMKEAVDPHEVLSSLNQMLEETEAQ